MYFWMWKKAKTSSCAYPFLFLGTIIKDWSQHILKVKLVYESEQDGFAHPIIAKLRYSQNFDIGGNPEQSTPNIMEKAKIKEVFQAFLTKYDQLNFLVIPIQRRN